jgi:UDP-N-acetylmuramoyl-tripeptide--D-alanyl-D-alanine ligase
MSTAIIASTILFLIGVFTFIRKRLLRYLRYLQQEEYQNFRFFTWLRKNPGSDTRGTLVLLIAFFLAALLPTSASISFAIVAPLAGLALATIGFKEEDPRNTGKIKLNMTERALRTHQVTLGINVALLLLITYSSHLSFECFSCIFLFIIFLFQLLPYLLIFANVALSPVERYLQTKFLNEAKAIVRTAHPYIIGVTGSYGKTSVKSYLGEVLNLALAPTFVPPKSFNTLMGITKEIRTRLNASFRFAVIEMGAYRRGSIRAVCKLTPPSAAIVTAVGVCHLERFGSAENVFLAKSELPQALPTDGVLVCNGDDPGARRIATENHRPKTYLYGFLKERGSLDCVGSDLRISRAGTSFNVTWQEIRYEIQTKLLGMGAASNLLATFTMAVALGANPATVIAALANIQPVPNRLALRVVGDITYLDDAYNSNPTGFRTALETLQALDATRRILMTPGMIELGSEQFRYNKEIAQVAAKICDLIVVVGPTNRTALLDGLAVENFPTEKILTVATRKEAFDTLAANQKAGDVILIENDLPDLYEEVVRF